MATLFNAFYVPVDGNGNVRASAKLYFYGTGTSTPANTYSDSGLSVTNANPVVADANGLFGPIYLDNSTTYKAVLKDSNDVTIATRDPITSLTPAAISGVLGYTPGNPTGSSTSFLANDVAMPAVTTYYAGPNTGSIGASGQIWEIAAKAMLYDTVQAAQFEMRVRDGTNTVDNARDTSVTAQAAVTLFTARVLTLSGATTFSIEAKSFSGTAGVIASSTDGGTTKFATSITAKRLR